MSAEKRLLVIGGPTASGKTRLALAMAQWLDTEILSADSRQFYREMNIGTAKPTREELALVPHHFINQLSISQSYSAGDFEREALTLLENLFANKDWVVLAGGSSLFIRAVCQGLDSFPAVSGAIRDQVEADYRQDGLSPLLEELATGDPAYYAQVDRANPSRIKRAVSFLRAHGEPFSTYRKGKSAARNFKPVYLCPYWPREQLYARIDQRVDAMMKRGLLAEVEGLRPHARLNALQTVGYKELFAYLDGTHSLKRAVELIKQNSRRYAKRQMTWMRNEPQWRRIGGGDIELAKDFIRLIKEGWQWKTSAEQDAEVFSFQNGASRMRMSWRTLKNKRLGLIRAEGECSPNLLEQLSDQAISIAEGKELWLIIPRDLEPWMDQLDRVSLPIPDWIKENLPDLKTEGYRAYKLSR